MLLSIIRMIRDVTPRPREGSQATKSRLMPLFILAAITVAVGFVAGLGGMGLGLLLRFVQHLAYGYSTDLLVSRESFLQGVSGASALRRFLALCTCGAVAGIGWWALFRYGRELVSITKAVKGTRMPFLSTLAHDFLQITTVALGSPLGRETAPRELGAVLATWLSDLARLTPEATRIMIACGAGAGLAAVYNVPLSGTVFTLEVLLGTFSLSALVPALITSFIGALIPWLAFGNQVQYSLPPLAISFPLTIWAVVSGPVFGFSAYWFVRATGAARARAPRDWRLLAWCGVVFPVMGLLAIPFPQLPGNGKGIAQLSFDGNLSLALVLLLLALRLLVIFGALRSGASGGLLTPGLSVGGLLGILLGGLWNHFCPFVPLGAFAVVGGAAFLAPSMKMPFTAIIIMSELTHIGHDFVIPISLCVAVSMSVFWLCSLRMVQPASNLQHESAPTMGGAPALAKAQSS